MRQKKTFDFNKLSDKDRKILAQRKLYNKIGKKVYDDNLNSDNINNGDNNNEVIQGSGTNNNTMDKDEINEKIDKQIKNEISREDKKENFFQEIERYNEEDDYFNIGKIGNKKIGEDISEKEMEEINNEKEKPTARGILEKVLNKIEYKNQQLINHNEAIANINRKKDKNSKKKNNL